MGPIRVACPLLFLLSALTSTLLLLGQDRPAAVDETLTKWVPAEIQTAAFPVEPREVEGVVRFLSHDRMQGRRTGTEYEALAAAYVASRFLEIGLEPGGPGGRWEQEFGVLTFRETPEGMKGVNSRSRNVIGWLPGTDETLREEHILIGAHFDHLGAQPTGEIFNGADDNASGVAGLIAVAKACAQGPIRPRRSILFVAFGAEERGLLGSKHYVREPVRPLEKLVAMINVDMIGRPVFLDRSELNGPRQLLGIPRAPGVGLLADGSAPQLVYMSRAACKLEGLQSYMPSDYPLLARTIEQFAAGRGDSAPFERRGVPAIFFSTSENDDYHRPTDTIDKVDPEIIVRISRAMWRTVLSVDALDDRAALKAK